MRARLAVVALSLASLGILTSCGGGPPQSEVDTETYIATIHNAPRVMMSANTEERVVEAETLFADWETQFDALLDKLRAQKVPEPQKAKLRASLEAELARMDEALNRLAKEPDKLTPPQRARMNKAYHKLVDKIKDSKIE
jgi:hypothetical protein